MLKTAYTEFKERHARAADWEIVFVSSDRDNASFDTYFEEMPWLALPFEEREAKAELNTLFKVGAPLKRHVGRGQLVQLLVAWVQKYRPHLRSLRLFRAPITPSPPPAHFNEPLFIFYAIYPCIRHTFLPG